MKRVAYSYIRLSTKQQVSRAKISGQIREAKQFAEEHGWVFSDVTFEDLGVSAYKEKNLEEDAALMRFAAGVKEGRIKKGSVLIVEQLDRITRASLITAVNIFTGLLKDGITIATLIDKTVFDPDEADDDVFIKLMLSLATFRGAHMESQKTSRRVKKAWRQKLERSFLTSRCPFWLKAVNVTKAKGETYNSGGYQPIKRWVKIIEDIFKMAIDGKGKRIICRALQDRGILTPKDKALWSESTIGKLLHDRALLGEFQPHEMVADGKKQKRVPKGDPIMLFPVVMDEKLFNSAQVALANRQTTNRKTRTTEECKNLFDGLLVCGYDDSAVHFVNKGVNSKTKKQEIWLINRKGRAKLGPQYSWEYSDFEEQFFIFLSLLRYDPKLLCETDVRGEELKSAANAKEVELLKIQKAQLNLYKLVEASGVTHELRNRIEELNGKEESLAVEIDKLQQERNSLTLGATDWSKGTAKIIKDYQRRANSVKFRFKLRNFVRSVVKRIDLYPKGLLFDEALYEETFSSGRTNLLQQDFGDPNYSSRVSSRYCLKELQRSPVKLLLTTWSFIEIKNQLAEDVTDTESDMTQTELKKFRAGRRKIWREEMAEELANSTKARNIRRRSSSRFFIVEFVDGAKRIFHNEYTNEDGAVGKFVAGVPSDQTGSGRLVDIEVPPSEKKKGLVGFKLV